MRSKTLAAVLALATILPATGPAAAFDTWWHHAATAAGGKAWNFSGDAIVVLQYGNFGPDLLGPAKDTVLDLAAKKGLPDWAVTGLSGSLGALAFVNAARTGAALVMHFDNLNRALGANWKFDYLFAQLLANTRAALSEIYTSTDRSPVNRKLLILMALGLSLHMVQDFYSHTDWIHQTFPMRSQLRLRETSYDTRAPTWFELKDSCSNSDRWGFRVRAGVYPDDYSEDSDLHSNIAHDNSQLLMGPLPVDARTPRAKKHQFPPYDAMTSPANHMLYAVRTACVASIEWIELVMRDPRAKVAIDFASQLDLKSESKIAKWHLEGAVTWMNAIGCLIGHFEGPKPPPDKVSMCRGFKATIVAAMANQGSPATAVAYSLTQNMFFKLWSARVQDTLVNGFLKRTDEVVGYAFPEAPPSEPLNVCWRGLADVPAPPGATEDQNQENQRNQNNQNQNQNNQNNQNQNNENQNNQNPSPSP